MSARRMFSPDIVSSDAFLDMPISSQALYFHLGMNADDDGFVNPKRVMRSVGTSDDDLKVLLSKRFLLPFESGVVVIKHWLIHNLIRADLYKETLYKNEKKLLGLNENGSYTEIRDGVSELKVIEAPKWLKQRRKDVRTANVPQTALRLGKVRLGKDRLEEYTKDFEEFWKAYPPTRKQDKPKCAKKFATYESEGLAKQIISDVVDRKLHHTDWVKENGRFVPAPLVYLNNQRWEAPIVGNGKLSALVISASEVNL